MRQNLDTWLSHHAYKGITFELGDNGPQLFYEARVRGISWMMLKLKTSHCWGVVVECKGALRLLNYKDQYWDGTVEFGPLYGKGDCTAQEPVALLEALADFILSGADPFDKHQS